MFCDWRERCKNEGRPKFFLRLARSNVFASSVNDAKMNADRSVFAPSATESFLDCCGPSTSFRWPIFFLRLAWPNILTTEANDVKMNVDQSFLAPGATECFATGANDAKMKADRSFFCAWRDRTFLRLAQTMQKWTPTEVFSRLVRPNLF